LGVKTCSKPAFAIVLAVACVLALSCARSHSQAFLNSHPVQLQVDVHTPFRFVAYGDARFTNRQNTDASNPVVRDALVQAVAQVKPAFICFLGDLVYNGYDANDWKIWDSETAVWRDDKIPVFPAIGNHELHGDQKLGLTNYFQRFRELKDTRYYSVRAGNTLFLMLDSSLDETSGPQGEWLTHQLDTLPPEIDFVFVVLHHPPYTSSSDMMPGGGHSARPAEEALAHMLESRQPNMRAQIVVFAGHVHNYERHEHGGITYFVSGGAGAHPYLIDRKPGDLFQGKGVNYHYLLVEVEQRKLTVTMNRLEMEDGKETWSKPDVVTISAPAAKSAAAR
jgi:acid phosphatase type 7